MAETTQRNEHQLLIGGKWVDASDGTYEIVNPATEEVVGLAPNASADDALAAAAAAKEAQPGWAAWSAEDRSALMRDAAAAIRAKSAELLPLVIAETGATATVGSRMQVPVAADRFERYARDPRRCSRPRCCPSRRRPRRWPRAGSSAAWSTASRSASWPASPRTTSPWSTWPARWRRRWPPATPSW